MKFIFTLLLVLTQLSLFGQGHSIQFKIEGLKDTTVYLGNYYGESTYLKDTALINSNGTFEFSGDKKLDPGMYFIVVNTTRLFDILIGKNQTFSVQTSTKDYIKYLQTKNDKNNELFFDDMRFNAARNTEAQPYVAVIRDSTSSTEDIASAREALNLINDKVVAHQNKIMTDYPNLLMTKILKANQPLNLPETPEGMDDAQFGYEYMHQHYWDNFDLGDPSLLRLARPLYKEKIENYFNRLVIPQADSIIKEINKLAEVAKQTEDTYKYFVWTVTILYQNPKIMGLDKVFVHIADRFFSSGDMDFWANKQLVQNLEKRANQLRLSLVGNIAPNMIMMDINQKMKSLYDIKSKYTVIYFFDPDCGHCKKETPVLRDFYNATQHDVDVYAVSADTSMVKMKNYIRDMNLNWTTVNGPRTLTGPYQDKYDANTTPTLYLLDDKKKIIAKRIPAARLEEFIKQYEKIKSRSN